jgi:molybdopterin synthase catalytic subunit
MKRKLTVTEAPIDQLELLRSARTASGMGAVIYFVGIVRGTEDGRPIRGIEYESFEKMVEHQFELLFDRVEQRWPIDSVRLVHRLGYVAAGEPSLWVELIAPHRGEAFAACQYLIEEMKQFVPIWKKIVPAD